MQLDLCGFVAYSTYFHWQSQLYWTQRVKHLGLPYPKNLCAEVAVVLPEALLGALSRPAAYVQKALATIDDNFLGFYFVATLAQNAAILGQYILSPDNNLDIILLSPQAISSLTTEFLLAPDNITQFLQAALNYYVPRPIDVAWHGLDPQVKKDKISRFWADLGFVYLVEQTFSESFQKMLPAYCYPETLIQNLYSSSISSYIADIVLEKKQLPIPNPLLDTFDSIRPQVEQSLSSPPTPSQLKTIVTDSLKSLISLHTIFEFLTQSLTP